MQDLLLLRLHPGGWYRAVSRTMLGLRSSKVDVRLHREFERGGGWMRSWNVRRVGGHTPQLDNIPFLLRLRHEKEMVRGDNGFRKAWQCSCGSNNPSDLSQCLDCGGNRDETEFLKSHIAGLCNGMTYCPFCKEEGR